MKTFAVFLLSKETFTIRTCAVLESFFRKLLSKATFERKLSGVSLPLAIPRTLYRYLAASETACSSYTRGGGGRDISGS